MYNDISPTVLSQESVSPRAGVLPTFLAGTGGATAHHETQGEP
jgi:hypothetical protein